MVCVTDKVIEAGVFLIDKPVDISSFGVVARMRKILGMKKVGHAGTLDPFATGLLIICAGRPATKMISQFMDGEKEYFATLRLGVETETLDTEGEIVKRTDVGEISALQIETCLEAFRGVQQQIPPAYSALKHKGKPLYYYARKGIKIEKEAREITISTLERTDGTGDIAGQEGELQIRVVCTKGTYIRTLGADIGTALGCGAHLTALRRTQSGRFSVEQSLSWEELSDDNAIDHCLKKMITVEEVAKLLQ
ncbi:MAG: tRNA pseudouridine(55) synthase TruB [Desulfotalea sp.]|nr:MAG: tRNA pseudouridine(55) synthase TruB [Desulfotalea sp.]